MVKRRAQCLGGLLEAQNRDNSMTVQAAAANQKSLLEEYKAEVAPPPGEPSTAPGMRKAQAAGKATDEGSSPVRNLDMVMRIPVTMKIVLGSATMPVPI